MDIYLPIAGQSVNALFTIAVASATSQISGASVSGVMVHLRRGGVDFKMGVVMIVGGLFGSLAGAGLFRMLQASGQSGWVASLPLRWRFYTSGLYVSPLAPLALGFVAGVLTMLLGIGGGFIMVPAMIYILGMAARGGGGARP